jgi:anti-anti-sigma regulatory factor
MLATPILRQGRVAGVIYLENDLATGAFTPERIEVLRTLATQAAISIENATLYARLEEQVAARTAELQSAYAQIVALSRAEKARQEQQMGEKLALIERQEQLIRILSMPILQVWDDVLTIPVVGDLDERRSAQMIEDLLERIVATRSRYAIIDLTGVREVDSATAERLGRVLQAVRLLGAEGVITGIGPAVAQVMTSLGLDLRGVATYGNLREGLRACMLRRAPRER